MKTFQVKRLIREAKRVLLGHILNPFWHNRRQRRILRNRVAYETVCSVLKKYLPFVQSISLEKNDSGETEEGKIFSIWFQGEDNAPRLVKTCFERIRYIYGERFIVLDRNTLFNWIDLPEYILKKWREGVITHAHFSDICRVELLYRHGGIWLDATDFLTSAVPEWIEKADIFIYGAGTVITPETLIQSCFMRSRKKHPLFGAWQKLIYKYWENENEIVDYFLLHYMLRFLIENNDEAREAYYSMRQIDQNPTHVLWHLHQDLPYSDELYLESVKDTFFQKTNFKCRNAVNPRQGTVADYMVNNKIAYATRLSDTGS